MNSETGEVKQWAQLTEEEHKSGKWIELPSGMAKVNFLKGKHLSKSDLRREEYMRRVAQKKVEGANV